MKKYIKIIAFFAVFAFAFSSFQIIGMGESAQIPTLSARAACLLDENGRLIYGKNENVRMPMASTTKIMTALVALESGLPLDTVIKIPKEAVGIEGSSLYLAQGEEITLEALLYGLLLCSANDAAIAIAIATHKTVEGFVEKMNEKANEIGLLNTKFVNPHGLPSEGHYTTALELGYLMAHCIRNESFLKISGCRKIVFPKHLEGVRVMINHNRLLSENIGVIAGKTGFTKKSGRCLVSCATREGLNLICVTLDAPNDWSDHKSLFEFGYGAYQKLELPSITRKIPLISGTRSEVEVSSTPLSVIIPKSFDEIEVKIESPSFLFAGLCKGEMIGRVVYSYNGKILATSPLVLCEDAQRIKYRFNLFEWLKNLFNIRTN